MLIKSTMQMTPVKLIAAYLGLLASCSVWATDINDIVNYQPTAAPKLSNQAQPYTVSDIVNMLPSALDDGGIYRGVVALIDQNDQRAQAFDENTFGECKEFYIHTNKNTPKAYGAQAFHSTLKYLFPANDEDKARASNMLKGSLAGIEHEKRSRITETKRRCPDPDLYSARLKEILDAVIKAAPATLQEKQRQVQIAQEEARKKQEHENEIARAKEQAEQEAKAEKQAIELAERKGQEERASKLKACQNTNDYRLYEASALIVNNRSRAAGAQQRMQEEKEGAKISGYVNTDVMYKMGNVVAGANRLNEDNFQIYKQLGGTARNVEAVQRLPNPCKEQ